MQGYGSKKNMVSKAETWVYNRVGISKRIAFLLLLNECLRVCEVMCRPRTWQALILLWNIFHIVYFILLKKTNFGVGFLKILLDVKENSMVKCHEINILRKMLILVLYVNCKLKNFCRFLIFNFTLSRA